jgi:hypothetical protein
MAMNTHSYYGSENVHLAYFNTIGRRRRSR